MEPEPTPQQEQAKADEAACEERVNYWLKKYGCSLIPVVELRPGQVNARIDLVKIPPEALKAMKKAEKGERAATGA